MTNLEKLRKFRDNYVNYQVMEASATLSGNAMIEVERDIRAYYRNLNTNAIIEEAIIEGFIKSKKDILC